VTHSKLLNNCTISVRAYMEWVFMEKESGYIQIHIWVILDTTCNIFLLKVYTSTYENYEEK